MKLTLTLTDNSDLRILSSLKRLGGQIGQWAADLIGVHLEDVRLYYYSQLVELQEYDESAAYLDDGDTLVVGWFLEDGAHPLHHAAYYGGIGAIQRWVAKGVAVDIRDRYESTPLMYAVQRLRTEAIQELLRLGADVNAVNVHGRTPLHAASDSYEKTAYDLLIANGADPTMRDNQGRTPRR